MIFAEAFYLASPVVLAGVIHCVVIKWDVVPWLAQPVDGGRRFRGAPLLGENKTWRGVTVMSAACTFGVLVQTALYRLPAFRSLSTVDYSTATSLALGVALGLGYSLGELPNSFVKRRLGIQPGGRAAGASRVQYVADQGDSVIGAMVALAFFVDSAALLAVVACLGFGLHIVMDQILYAVGVKHRSVRPQLLTLARRESM